MEPQLKLIARNFRTLESLEWSPRPGVNLLVGPNGSGKTTVLSALKFLSVLFRRDRAGALNAIRGVHLGRRGAPEAEPFHLELHHGEVHWTLDFPVNARGLTGTYGELLQHGDEVILRAKMFAEEWYLGTTRRKFPSDERCCARIFWDLTDPPAEWMRPLVDLLHNLRVYGVYNLEILRQPAQDDVGPHDSTRQRHEDPSKECPLEELVVEEGVERPVHVLDRTRLMPRARQRRRWRGPA